ncbi:MAG: two-component system, cell cycle response regulator [Clostridiales bacterium]|nr:two-component system, cell cycle response regulator [Clostridiales bacterium]
MNIDLRTTVITYVFINYICAAITCSIWLHNKDKFQGLQLIFLDFILQSIGLTLASFQNFIPDMLSIFVANNLMYLGAMLFPFAIGQFSGIAIKKWHYRLAFPVFAILYGYFTFVTPNVRIRLIVFTLMVIPIFLHTAYLVFKRADPQHRTYTLRIGIAQLLLTVIHGFRTLWAYLSPSFPEYYHYDQIEAILVILSQLLTIYVLFAVTQMIQMKLLNQLDNYISRTEQLLDKTNKLATIDDLTQVFNRRKTENDLAMAIINFNLYHHPLSVLMIDIDHFKRFNDTYGHDIGDRVLIDVAHVLKANIRNTDIIGRWGGEEFLIVLQQSDIKAAEAVGIKLVEAVRDISLHYCTSPENVSVSIGCAEAEKFDTLDKFIKRADVAMYNAKKSGRDRVVISE